MHPMLRLTLVPVVLLAAGATLAQAESPLPDPVAPAVLGRPLDQIRSARPVHKPVLPAPARSKQVTARAAAPRPVAATRIAARPVAAQAAVAAQSVAASMAPDSGEAPRAAKQALDDRADPRMQLNEVGKGSHFSRKALGTGVFIGDKPRAAVLKYYQQHPASDSPVPWQVGAPVPQGAKVKEAPRDLLAAVPEAPPGHIYVQWGGDLVLVAQASRMVVDGVSRGAR